MGNLKDITTCKVMKGNGWLRGILDCDTIEGEFRRRIEGMGEDLASLSYFLSFAEVAASAEDAVVIARYRSGIDSVANSISTPFLVHSKVSDIIQIAEAVDILGRIDIQADPERAAKQFGKALAGIGRIAAFLPPPASYFADSFAGAENFFYNTMQNIVPHLKPNFRRVNEQWKKAGIDLFE